MATTIVATAYPVDVFDPEVTGAPLITRAGVAVDNTKLTAVQAAAAANGVPLLAGGAGPASPTPSDPVIVLPAYINYAGPPTSGTFRAGQQVTDSNGAVWVANGGSPGTFTTPGSATYAPLSTTARLALQAARAPTVARVLDKFLTGGTGIAVGRSGTTYQLYRGIYPGLFARYDLVADATEPGGYSLHQLQGLSIVSPMQSKAYGDASVASSGTYTAGTNAAAYNGGYVYSTAAASKTFTSPACTALGLRIPKLTNGGMYSKVTIDGDATLADGLPTAQDEVTAGRLASTALVANGGTLNPTDRVFASYVSSSGLTNYDVLTGLAAGLSNAVHTVVVSNTGYSMVGLSSQRAYIAGFSYAAATAQPTDSGAVQMPVAVLNALNSAWEHAVEVTPAGATPPTFLGNVHGYEVEDSFTVAVDGSTVSLTDGQIVAGAKTVTVTRLGHLLHPETSTTKVADTQVIYSLGRYGMTVDDTITWAVSGTLTKAYAMLPLNGALSNVAGATKFTRAGLLEYPGGTFTFTGGNGDSYYGASKSAAAWFWGGKAGVLMHLPDVETYTNDWANSANLTQVEDRNGTISKAYIGRSWGTAETIAPGGKVAQRTTYTTGFYPASAEAVLAAL